MRIHKEEKKEYKNFIGDVLVHYKTHGRNALQWRKNITPYRILVSEVMLQQTQVLRVISKFETWMNVYPTLTELRTGTLHDVLILWQGLGYQRRAKSLLSIAKERSVLPETFDELRALPGVGIYTASAICAFAYNRFAHPLLETNIRTALIEYFHIGENDISDGVLYDDLTRLEAYAEVQKLGARNWYYALMDFGAHLKSTGISHNKKSAHHVTQSSYKGSLRELRARTLFAITHGEKIPVDERIDGVLLQLAKEGYIIYVRKRYQLAKL